MKLICNLLLVLVATACGNSDGSGGDASAPDTGTSPEASFDGSIEAASDADSATDAGTTCGASVACRGGQTCVAGACEYAACSGQHVPGDYATLTGAIAALQSTGGTICLGASTYVELPPKNSYDVSAPITIQGVSSAQSIVKLERVLAVNATADFTIRGASISKIDEPDGGTDNDYGALSFFGTSGTFTVENSTVTGSTGQYGAAIQLSGGALTVRSSTLVGMSGGGVWVNASKATVLLDGDDISASNGDAVFLTMNGLSGAWSPSVTVQNSYIHDSIAGISYDNGNVYKPTMLNATLVIDNDTFLHDTTAIDLNGPQASTVSLTYFNDIIAQNQKGISIVTTTAPTVASGNNLLFANTTSFGGSAADGTNDVKADPLLGSNMPPSPQSGSPAIGAGDSSHAPPNDYWDTPRGGSVDLGCVQ